jgi:hypothetical protein
MSPKATKARGRKKILHGTDPGQVKGKAGVAEAKAAASMTKEKWRDLQQGMKEKWPQPKYMQDRQDDRPHTMYMDETYEIVTRWMATTRIEYRPHAKAPGSKSHVRYEQYSKAKTVGQALALGSWPADWCWDYERGFIKAKGLVRDEPLDPVTVEDEKALTDVDKAIYGWSVKELAKKFGFSVQDLYKGTSGSGESAIMRAHRLHAQKLAKAALLVAKEKGQRVKDDDMYRCLAAWGFARNPNRQNVNPEGREWVWSDNMGLTRDRLGSIHITKATTKYPEFTELICKWLTDRLPDECKHFKFTSLNLNKNYAARVHRDGNNFGPSMIAAFGKFSGGELNYWAEDDKQNKLEALPAKATDKFQIGSGLALFNGNSAHCVDDFEGERFSIVYFTSGCHAKLVPEDVQILEELGMPYPPENVDEFSLIRKPRGYTAKGIPAPAPRGESKLPPSAFWSRTTLEKQRFKLKPLNKTALTDWVERATQLSKKAFVLRRPEGSKATSKRKDVSAAGSAGKKRRLARAGA